MLTVLKKLNTILEKENFAHEVFSQETYQALVTNLEKGLAFLYVDILNSPAKMSLCRTNTMLIKNFK